MLPPYGVGHPRHWGARLAVLCDHATLWAPASLQYMLLRSTRRTLKKGGIHLGETHSNRWTTEKRRVSLLTPPVREWMAVEKKPRHIPLL